MFAPPKRNGMSARVRWSADCSTNRIESARAARAGPRTRTASWCRMGVLASILAAVAVAARSYSEHAGRLVVTAPGYRVALSAQNRRLLEIDDAQGRKLLGGAYGCL